jgi:hypothetical protein
MRTYYASDKKRREEAKRKQQEQKRLKRQGKNATSQNSSELAAQNQPGSENDPTKNSGQ